MNFLMNRFCLILKISGFLLGFDNIIIDRFIERLSIVKHVSDDFRIKMFDFRI